MTARRIALALLAIAAFPASSAAARNHSVTVNGWRFDWIDHTGDGGWQVRMNRRGPGYRFSYYYEFWRGNGGVVVGASFERGSCRSGEAGSIMPFAEGMSRATLNAKLADYLRECPLAPAEAAALRRGANAAWPRFAAMARRARAAMEAEIRAIADHGR